MSINGQEVFPPNLSGITLPHIKPIRLGEYGRALEGLWPEFEKIRKNGIYAADRNITHPSFGDKFLLHGYAGRHTRLGKEFVFTPPQSFNSQKNLQHRSNIFRCRI